MTSHTKLCLNRLGEDGELQTWDNCGIDSWCSHASTWGSRTTHHLLSHKFGIMKKIELTQDQKERQARGETQGMSELTENQVQEILKSKESHQVLANRYGVTRANISYIKRGKTWKHIEGVRVQDITRPRKDSTIGIRGVSPERNKFRARIQVDRQRRYLGTFETVEEATEAIRKARLL